MNLTTLEKDMIVRIARSEYTQVNGAVPKTNAEIETVWANVIIRTNADKGVFTSLNKKGMVGHTGPNDRDAGVYLTDEGFAAFQAIHAERNGG